VIGIYIYSYYYICIFIRIIFIILQINDKLVVTQNDCYVHIIVMYKSIILIYMPTIVFAEHLHYFIVLL